MVLVLVLLICSIVKTYAVEKMAEAEQLSAMSAPDKCIGTASIMLTNFSPLEIEANLLD